METLLSVVVLGAILAYYCFNWYWEKPFGFIRNQKRKHLHASLVFGLLGLVAYIFFPEISARVMHIPVWTIRFVSSTLTLALSIIYHYRGYQAQHRLYSEGNTHQLSFGVIVTLTLCLAKLLQTIGLLLNMHWVLAWGIGLWLACNIQVLLNLQTYLFGESTQHRWKS